MYNFQFTKMIATIGSFRPYYLLCVFFFAFLNDLGPKSSKIAIVNSRNFWHIFDLCFNLCARIVARRGKLRAICTY